MYISNKGDVTMKNLDTVYAEKIAEEYSSKKTSKVVALKKLDRKAKQPAEIFTYSYGIIGALILGTGMCLSMGVVGSATLPFMILGVILGIIGIGMVATNYYFYRKLLEKGKQKYAFEIIELAKEITDSEN